GGALGTGCQVVDAGLDYGGGNGALGKNTGDDWREGKMTLPVILALGNATARERDTLAAALGNREAGAAVLDSVLAIFARHNTLARTMAEAERHAQAARDALDTLPASPMRDILLDVPEFCVSRAY